MTNEKAILLACAALAIWTMLVGVRMVYVRVREMKATHIHPQSVALSHQRLKAFEDSRASDNYNHLFELPVLFYALCALAVASGHIPDGLPWAVWSFVGLRVIHSLIQCTYNRVVHRFLIFCVGLAVLALIWAAFTVSVLWGHVPFSSAVACTVWATCLSIA